MEGIAVKKSFPFTFADTLLKLVDSKRIRKGEGYGTFGLFRGVDDSTWYGAYYVDMNNNTLYYVFVTDTLYFNSFFDNKGLFIGKYAELLAQLLEDESICPEPSDIYFGNRVPSSYYVMVPVKQYPAIRILREDWEVRLKEEAEKRRILLERLHKTLSNPNKSEKIEKEMKMGLFV